MKLLLVVSCLVVAVAAKPLFGTEQCANGPEVWCVDVRSASQCGAVKHCQQTVWNRPVVKSVPCDLCKEAITIIENFLKDNGTESEIEQYLNKICELLIPDPSTVAQCKQIVAEYLSIILNLIEEELGNPSVVCRALHLCTSLQQHLASLKPAQQLLSNEIPDVEMSKVVYPFMANLPLLFPQDKAPEAPKIGDICKDCLQLVSDIQESLKTNSSFGKSLIENALKQCEQLGGGLSDVCKTYVNQYGELGIQMFIQMPAQVICSASGLCAQEKSSPMVEMTPAKVIVPALKLQPAVKITEEPLQFDTLCELCEVVVTKLEELLKNNSTEEHIKQVLEEICYIVPPKYRSKCKDFIDNYSTAIIELLEQEVTPKAICMVIGCCSSRERKLVKLSSEHIQSGGACPVCKIIVQYMDKILSKNVTQERIKAALHVVCNYLPDKMADECLALVDLYEGLFIELLLQAMDPTFVCEKMNLCSNAKPLLGSEKCMWGPSYWCKDMETAGNCNAIEHCKRHVWN